MKLGQIPRRPGAKDLASNINVNLAALQRPVVTGPHMSESIHPHFCIERPSAQTALDIFKGAWRSRILGNLESGPQDRFSDTRLEWFMNALGLNSLEGLRVLELGPFEAYNTYQLCNSGASEVTAIEGNTINFLKCLVVKEVLGFRARFLCGDFIEYLRACEQPYDLVWSCGVLYHQVKPLELLRLIMKNARHVFIWTHYYNDSIQSTPHAREFDSTKDQMVLLGDEKVTLKYRSYLIDNYEHNIPLYYESGFRPYAYWMSKPDILRVFEQDGFSVRVMIDTELDRLPVIAFLATREAPHG